MSNAFIVIAVGGNQYFQMVLNCCLSIKTHEEIPVILIHDEHAAKGNRELMQFFDECIQIVPDKNAQRTAMLAKLKVLQNVESLPYEKFILLDSDVLILPSKKPSEFFNQEGNFVTYVNDLFDYNTQSSQRDNANFWCEPMKARGYFNLKHNLPQINASFIYFTKEAKSVFDTALDIWNDKCFEYKGFRGSKTEELCFNIAMSKLGIIPKQVPYRPVFFQCYSENVEDVYIQHSFRAMGLAGDIKHDPAIIDLYNRTAKYYRNYFGLKREFIFKPKEKKVRRVKHIEIPHTRRTIYRAGEVENSAGGIFNPDALLHKGVLYEIFRKEKDFDLYKRRYSHSSAIAHLKIGEQEIELKPHGWDTERLEDFRLFSVGDSIWCNHTVCYPDRISRLPGQQYDKIQVGLSRVMVNERTLYKLKTPPFAKSNLEKNWMFWTDKKHVYCLYSLNPFVLYKDAEDNQWEQVNVKQPKFKWFHNQYICNSTNPIEIDGYLLIWFHTKQDGFYYHGCLLMDKKTKVIKYQTKRPIKIDGRNDGLHKNLHYVSGCVYLPKEKIVRVYLGENDSHAYVVEFDKDKLFKAIKK